MNTSNDDISMSAALGIAAPTQVATTNTTPVLEGLPASDDQIYNDAEYARTQVYDVLTRGAAAVDLAIKVAESLQTPWAVSVLGQLLKTQAENVEKLLKVQRDRMELNRSNAPTNNTTMKIDKAVVFQGTSDELVRMIRDEQKNIIDVEIDG